MQKHVFFLVFFSTVFLAAISAQDVTLEKEEEGHRIVIYAVNNSDIVQEVSLELRLEHVTVDRELPSVEILAPGERAKMAVLEPEPLQPWSYKTGYTHKEYVEPVEETDTYNTPLPSSEPEIQSHPAETDKLEEKEFPSEELDNIEGDYDRPSRPIDDVIEDLPMESDPPNADGAKALPPMSPDDEPVPPQYAAEVMRSFEAEGASASDNAATDEEKSASEIIVYGQNACPRCTFAKTYLDESKVEYEYFNITADRMVEEEMKQYLFMSGYSGGSFTMPVIVIDGTAHYNIDNMTQFLLEVTQ